MTIYLHGCLGEFPGNCFINAAAYGVKIEWPRSFYCKQGRSQVLKAVRQACAVTTHTMPWRLSHRCHGGDWTHLGPYYLYMFNYQCVDHRQSMLIVIRLMVIIYVVSIREYMWSFTLCLNVYEVPEWEGIETNVEKRILKSLKWVHYTWACNLLWHTSIQLYRRTQRFFLIRLLRWNVFNKS